MRIIKELSVKNSSKLLFSSKSALSSGLLLVLFCNVSLISNAQAVQVPHKFALVKIEPSKTLVTPDEELSVTLALESIATPSFNTSYNGCVMRPFLETDFISESGGYENDNTPGLRFEFDLVVEFMQNNQVISGPYFMSLAMLHNGNIVAGKQDGYDMQIWSVDNSSGGKAYYSNILEQKGTIPVIMGLRSSSSYPIKFKVPSTGDVYAQYYFVVSQYQTADMSSEAKRNQNYKCGGYTTTQDLYFSGRQVSVISNSTKLSQSVINFNLPKTSAINLQALQLRANSNGGNAVEFKSLTPRVCLVNGQVLLFRNTGKCKVEAVATESSKYLRSAAVIKEVSVVPKGSKYEIICRKGNTFTSVIGAKPKCPSGSVEN